MDELTLNGENYISSKRAAKVTGYTKDYVGQLCREGKIDAQLVGRNWYISEASIHEHRFGTEGDLVHSTHDKVKHEKHLVHTDHRASDDKIIYTHDDVDTIPLQSKKHDVDNMQESDTQQEVQQQSVKSDVFPIMQNVWQEWFTTATHTIRKDSHELHDHPQKEQTATDTSAVDNTGAQPVSIRKLVPMHINDAKKSVYRNASSQKTQENYPKRRDVTRVINVASMIIALIFFTVTVLNMFLNVHSSVVQLQYLTGTSVYVAQ